MGVLTAGHAVVMMVLSKTITEIVLISIAVLMKISAMITMIALMVREVTIVPVNLGSTRSVLEMRQTARFVKMSMSVMMFLLINAQLILNVKTPMVDFHVTVMMVGKPTLMTHLSA